MHVVGQFLACLVPCIRRISALKGGPRTLWFREFYDYYACSDRKYPPIEMY
jgi:hypothetical protein